MYGKKVSYGRNDIPEQPEELLQLHPYILCLTVDQHDWETLKNNPYTANVEMLVPIFGQDDLDEFARHASIKWAGNCILFDKTSKRYVTKVHSNQLETHHIVTLEEFRNLWSKVSSAQKADTTKDGIRKWICVSQALRDAYLTVYFKAIVELVEDIPSWTCYTYCQFIWLQGLLENIMHSVQDMEQLILINKELEKECLPIYKKWITVLEKIYDKFPGVSLGAALIKGVLNFLGPPEELIIAANFSSQENALLERLQRENYRRLWVINILDAMFRELVTYPNDKWLEGQDIFEYLHFDLHGLEDYLLIFERTVKFLEGCEKSKYGHVIRLLSTLFPAMFLVLTSGFSHIIPQTVNVGDLTPEEFTSSHGMLLMTLLASSITERYYHKQGLDLYMSSLTLARYKVHKRELEDDSSGNHLPYLQPSKSLDDFDVAQFYETLTRIETATFYRIVFEENVETKFLQGERLYAIADHLMFVEEIRDVFPAYSERACQIFCEDTDSTLDFSSLLIYYKALEKHMTPSQLEIMTEKLIERKKAERTCISYFYDPKQVRIDNFRKCTTAFPYVFFLAFVKVYLFLTQCNEMEERQSCVDRLVDTMEFYPKLKNLLINKKVAGDKYFHELIYKKLTTAAKNAPLDQFKNIFSNDWGNVLGSTSPVRFKSYEESSLRKIRKLSDFSGQAVVELVNAPRLPVEVVSKRFQFDKSNGFGHKEFMQMKEEIRALLTSQCNPHIVSLYGYIVNQHRVVGLLMEFCKGGSLQSVIKNEAKDYSETSIVLWSLQAACGLDFIHASTTIHRDVKPDNMLLDENHEVLKISDLGIARLCEIGSNVLQCDYTSDNGTRGYRAPEIVEGDVNHYTDKVDVFGLGRSIWSMAYRCHPREPLDETLEKKVLVSQEIWEFVERMMEEDRDKRPTMAEVYTFFEGHHSFKQ